MRGRIGSAIRSPRRFQRIRDFLLAEGLYRLPVRLRKRLFAGSRHLCPICGSHVRTFLRLHRPYHAFCPVCRSLQRHRLVWLFFQRQTNLFDGIPRRMLHIAPEQGLTARFRAIPGLIYHSADLHDRRATERMDIADIHHPDGSFDLIYCSHVLEHVPDDRRAMRELSRVLAPDGWATILVPISASATFEDPTISDPAERERRFGQSDHVRVYGPDVQVRLMEAGFRVTDFSARDFAAAEEIQRFCLNETQTILFCQR